MKVDVLIPFRNGEKTVESCLSSISCQKEHVERLVLVNDFSSDSTCDLIEKYRSKFDNIMLLNSPERGISHALNFGLQHCKSEITARLDIDDLMEPNRLHKQIEYIKSRTNVAVVGSAVNILTNDIKYYKTSVLEFEPQINYKKLLDLGIGNFFITPHPSVCLRTEVVLSLGGYRNLEYCEDLDLWIRILQSNYEIHNIPEILTTYRYLNKSSLFDLDTARRRAWVTSLLISCAKLNMKFEPKYVKFNMKDSTTKLINRHQLIIDYAKSIYVVLIRSWPPEAKCREYHELKNTFTEKGFTILKDHLTDVNYRNARNSDVFLNSTKNMIEKIFFDL